MENEFCEEGLKKWTQCHAPVYSVRIVSLILLSWTLRRRRGGLKFHSPAVKVFIAAQLLVVRSRTLLFLFDSFPEHNG